MRDVQEARTNDPDCAASDEAAGPAMPWHLPDGIDTPALVVDLDTLAANVRNMARAIRAKGVDLRPHAKTHKSIDVARLQREHGAKGLTVASIGEAEVFAAAGSDDIFVAYPVFASPPKRERLDALAAQIRLSIGIDSVESATALAGAKAAESIRVLIEVDSGQHRTGIQPTAAGALAASCRDLGLEVDGVFTHAGHAYNQIAAPPSAAAGERAALELAVAALAAHGISARTVSAGSTPTAVESAGGAVTEERPGSYVFNDRQQLALGIADREEVALVVAATVVSTAVPGQVVIDAGSKALGRERPDWLHGYGVIPELSDAPLVSLTECHGIVALGSRRPSPAVGSVVSIIPNHVCPVVNLFDRYQVVSAGQIVDQWPVSARGRLE